MNKMKSIFKTTCIKARYRATIISEITIKYIKRAGNVTGRGAAMLMVSLGSQIKKAAKKTVCAIGANKKKVAIGALTACAFAFCGLATFNALTAYEYSYDGQTLGIVAEPECVYDGIEQAEETLTKEIGAQVVIDKNEDIQVKRVLKDTDKVGEEEDVVNALTSIEKIKVVSYALNITSTIDKKTGETTTHSIYLDTKEHVDEVLNKIKSEYTKDIEPKKLLEVKFEEGISATESKVLLEDIIDTPAAIKFINTGGIEEKIHVVKLGDSVASIASKYDVSRKNLKKWNSKIKDDNILYVGQEIQLREQIPLLHVITKQNVTITEDFDAQIKYDDTDNLYKGQEIVTKEGKSGNRTVNADIIERNGKQIDRIDLSFVVHKEPTISEVMRGTKERPDKIGKGYYSDPMSGSHTSSFGNRWGRLHAGMDIAGPSGTNVYAADAGVVTSAGSTSNGYGIAVRIDHGKGRTTYYAHNSKVLVKVGDIVYRGQQIAESGNTGNSTGPHLHFETRFGGVAKDPAKYL